ncbi:MAG: hypothetical protein H6577_19420 [Lewinellaceae bacterium]|nr:hypothetical protein [Saprospiraceae bacterium]MCB9340297.1 hypothetical protein [Lewinellaceae bacterium]
MLEKNSLPLGLFLGILLPIVGFAVLYGLYETLDSLGWVSDVGFRPKFRERTIGILAIALNVFLLNYYQKLRFTQSIRGIVVMTILWVVLWMVLFGKYVL